MKTPNGGRKGSGLKPPSAPGIQPPKAVKPQGNGSAKPLSTDTMGWFKSHMNPGAGVLRPIK